ncbi:MAG: cellulase family glycosylhydrolase [Spirochaetota bacterium]
MNSIFSTGNAFTPAGKMTTRSSRVSDASRFSIGFECLDRKMFDDRKMYPNLANLGVKWARVQTGWSQCEKEKGVFDFAWLDAIVDTLLSIGIQPWFNCTYGNQLYTPEATHQTAIGWTPMYKAEAAEGWVRFVARLAKHYKGRVTHFEIWNEPDLNGHAHFWRPYTRDPFKYTELVKISAASIRKANPQAFIIGGAFAHGLDTYVEDCLNCGIADVSDAITYHFYGKNPDEKYEDYAKKVRETVHRRRSIPVWQGESGVPSGMQTEQAMAGIPWTEEAQAKWLLRRSLLDVINNTPFISYFHAADFSHYITDRFVEHTYYYGVMRADGSMKPSFQAYQSICSLFGDATKYRGHEGGYLFDANGDIKGVPVHAFFRNGKGLTVFWKGVDLLEPYAPPNVSIRIPHEHATGMTDPVIIDTITQEVFRITKKEKREREWVFSDIPLIDYPIIITDATTVL